MAYAPPGATGLEPKAHKCFEVENSFLLFKHCVPYQYSWITVYVDRPYIREVQCANTVYPISTAALLCLWTGVVEYFGTRINRNRFPKILGYFGTIPIYPVPGGRIFGNLQDISEPPSRRFHMIF